MSEQEYKDLREFLWFYTEVFAPIGSRLASDERPIARLDATEKKSKARAARGLRMAINDLIEKHRHDSSGRIMEIDGACRSQGVITLSELRRRFSRDYASILRAGKIRRESDYYLVQGVLVDGVSAISAKERSELQEMALAYELAAVQKANSRTKCR